MPIISFNIHLNFTGQSFKKFVWYHLERERERDMPGTKLDSWEPRIQWGGYGSSGLFGWWESRNAITGHFFSQKSLAILADSSTIWDICLFGSLGAYKHIPKSKQISVIYMVSLAAPIYMALFSQK